MQLGKFPLLSGLALHTKFKDDQRVIDTGACLKIFNDFTLIGGSQFDVFCTEKAFAMDDFSKKGA